MTKNAGAIAHHTIAEISGELRTLDDAGWSRLGYLARNRCRNRLHGREEDILQDAITRPFRANGNGPMGSYLRPSFRV